MGVLLQDDLLDRDCSDYTLEDDAPSVWITVGNISVYVMRTKEGVSVELLPLDNEAVEAIDVAYALDSDGLPDDREEEDEDNCPHRT